MGNQTSTPIPGGVVPAAGGASASAASPVPPPGCPVHAAPSGGVAPAAATTGSCPVDHSKLGAGPSGTLGSAVGASFHHGGASAASAAAAAGEGGACPVKHSSAAAAGPVYNVYAEVIDPKNMMPANPNQKPAPGQKAELSTARQESSIPKGGTEASTWLYPSPQMFYNALVRKQKADGVREEDVSVVVAIHNNMNERTWRSLLSWEESHKAELAPGCPKLRRFMGRPYDLSPKARVRSWLGGGYPFDRHDWFIDRGDGVERRYVIDYYFDTEANAKATTLEESLAAIQVDVRPALDSPGAVLDRLLAFPGRLIEASKRKRFYADGMDPRKMPKEAIAHGDSAVVASGGGATAAAVSLALDTRGGATAPTAPAPVGKLSPAQLESIDKNCKKLRERLQAAKTEEERSAAYIALNYCIGRVACPSEADRFMAAVEATTTNDEAEQAAFQTMYGCIVEQFTGKVASERA